MKYPKGVPCHDCAPKDWKHTPNLTGNFETDASIMHAKSKRLHQDLINSIKGGDPWASYDPHAYSPRSMYNGYRGYSGDD